MRAAWSQACALHLAFSSVAAFHNSGCFRRAMTLCSVWIYFSPHSTVAIESETTGFIDYSIFSQISLRLQFILCVLYHNRPTGVDCDLDFSISSYRSYTVTCPALRTWVLKRPFTDVKQTNFLQRDQLWNLTIAWVETHCVIITLAWSDWSMWASMQPWAPTQEDHFRRSIVPSFPSPTPSTVLSFLTCRSLSSPLHSYPVPPILALPFFPPPLIIGVTPENFWSYASRWILIAHFW